MKTKNLLQTIILILSFAMMNQFAKAQSGCSNCNGTKVKMHYCNDIYCNSCVSKCINANQVQSYQSQGWIYGKCPSCPVCCPVRMSGNESTTITSLTSIYPNPASGTTSISFSVFQTENISLKIFDINGRLIGTLADKIFEEGENEIVWNAADVNAGVYFLQFQSVENLQTEKLIVTK